MSLVFGQLKNRKKDVNIFFIFFILTAPFTVREQKRDKYACINNEIAYRDAFNCTPQNS